MRKYLYFILFIPFLNACSEKKQNIVVIMVDDLGWSDLGYSESSFYETPNIDALSKQSIQFTSAYAASSVCSPTRAAIMTGKHPARVNITDWIPGSDPKNRPLLGPVDLNELPLAEVTLAEAMKINGYTTFFAGKWHLGDEGFFPEDQGFEINIGGHHMGHPPGGYYSPYNNPKLSDGVEGEYLTDRLTDESIKFLDGIDEAPFLLYLAFYTVHTPIQANLTYIDKFKTKLRGLEIIGDSIKAEGEGITNLDQRNAAYASMVYALDVNVGRLIEKLKKEGLYENTTIFFTSDNGGLATLDARFKRLAPTANLPLRAGKGWLYEGGIRIPLLIKPANYRAQNRISSEPVISHDLYPTILALADIEIPDTTIIDGYDLAPILNGEEHLNRTSIFWHYPHYHGSAWKPGAAIRAGDWKLIEFYETNSVELYNLSDDIEEHNDLATKYPEKVAALKETLHARQNSMHANKAIINPDYQAKETG